MKTTKTNYQIQLEREKASAMAGLETLRNSILVDLKAKTCQAGKQLSECNFVELMEPSIKTKSGKKLQSYEHKGMRHYVARCKTCGFDKYQADKI